MDSVRLSFVGGPFDSLEVRWPRPGGHYPEYVYLSWPDGRASVYARDSVARLFARYLYRRPVRDNEQYQYDSLVAEFG